MLYKIYYPGIVGFETSPFRTYILRRIIVLLVPDLNKSSDQNCVSHEETAFPHKLLYSNERY